MARPLATRSRQWLTAGVSFALFAVACTANPAASPGPTVVPGASASPASGAQATPTDDPVDPTASAVDSWPGGEVRWSRVAAPFGDPPTATWIDGVVEWRSRLVAFGRVKAPGRNQLNELAAVFLSDTGETWRPIPIDAGVGPEDTSEISHLAAGPRGIVVFGGTCCAVEEGANWYSPDGDAWERVPVDPPVFDGSEIAAARATDDGFVMVGSRSGRAAVWTSDDGRSWTVVDQVEAGLGKGAIGDVAPADGRWLAAGYQDDGDTYDGALWESPDGVQWRRLPADRLFGGELDTAFERLDATPGGLLLLGSEGPHNELGCRGPAASLDSVGRLAAARRLASGGQRETAISCGWGVETHWWSSDGRSWERLPPVRPAPGEPPLTGPGPLEFRLITTGGPGLLNLGEDRSGVVRLWASPDGRDWQELGSGDILRSGQDMASGIAALGGRVIAVGDAWDAIPGKPGEPAVWIGLGL